MLSRNTSAFKEERKVERKKKKELISNMIKESNYSDARISRLTRVPVERVQEIRAELKNKNSSRG